MGKFTELDVLTYSSPFCEGSRRSRGRSSAKSLGTPPFPLADLPKTRDDSLWTDLRSEYGLSLAELSSLKNHVSERQEQHPVYSMKFLVKGALQSRGARGNVYKVLQTTPRKSKAQKTGFFFFFFLFFFFLFFA